MIPTGEYCLECSMQRSMMVDDGIHDVDTAEICRKFNKDLSRELEPDGEEGLTLKCPQCLKSTKENRK